MGILDLFRKDGLPARAKSLDVGLELPPGEYSMGDAEIRDLVSSVRGLSPRALWEQQHNVRMVVDFLSRNIGQLGLHAYQHDGNGGRVRVRDSAVANVLAAPNAQMTTYDLIVALVSDLALFDEAWWLVREHKGKWEIRPLPVERVSIFSGREIDGDLVVAVAQPGNAVPVRISQKHLLHFRGWDPSYTGRVSPAVGTLRDVLAEQVASQKFRLNVWENGGQIAQYVHRPKDAAQWSLEAEKHFTEGMEQYRAEGGKSGKMPLLGDGMEIRQTRFNAKEEQWAEAAQLALETVARAWHINPAMLGATGGVSYANVREFRKMLYGETLGPWLRMIQDRLNRFLLPMVGEEPGAYVEFNVKSKLAASFDEQAAVMSSAVGRPWMTANEARGLENLPALDGDADALVTPLNVLTGGQASSRDSGTQNLRSGPVQLKSAGVRIKAVGREQDAKAATSVVAKFFARQRRVVLSNLGVKDAAWWDEERWDEELTDDLLKLALRVSEEVAHETLGALDVDAGEYSVPQTKAFLAAVAAQRAKMVNATTRGQVQAALDDDLGEDAEGSTPSGVFDLAESSRSEQSGKTLATTLAAFAVTEAAKQLNRPRTTKTWLVLSGNPRSSHAAMNGETVGIDSTFSNGAEWPGSSSLDVDEVAGCQCGVEVTVG